MGAKGGRRLLLDSQWRLVGRLNLLLLPNLDAHTGDDMTHAGKYRNEPDGPQRAHHWLNREGRVCYPIGRQIQMYRMKQDVEKNGKSTTGKKFDRAFREVTLAPFFRSRFFALWPSSPTPATMFHRAARNFGIHLFHRARDLFGNVSNLDVAHDLLQLRRHAVGLGDRITKS